jgi:hypothetical protein
VAAAASGAQARVSAAQAEKIGFIQHSLKHVRAIGGRTAWPAELGWGELIDLIIQMRPSLRPPQAETPAEDPRRAL